MVHIIRSGYKKGMDLKSDSRYFSIKRSNVFTKNSIAVILPHFQIRACVRATTTEVWNYAITKWYSHCHSYPHHNKICKSNLPYGISSEKLFLGEKCEYDIMCTQSFLVWWCILMLNSESGVIVHFEETFSHCVRLK